MQYHYQLTISARPLNLGMEAYGRKCPLQYLNSLTPMEFDEMVLMFNEYDVDKSNTIDKHEARKILFNLGLDHTMVLYALPL